MNRHLLQSHILLPFWLILILVLASCTPSQTAHSALKHNQSNDFQVKQQAEPELPIQQDPSSQIVILAQDGEYPISVTTQLTYPKEMTIGFQDFSLVPNRLIHHVHEAPSQSEKTSRLKADQQLLKEWFDYFSAALWDAVIRGQQANYAHAEARYKQKLAALETGSAAYQQLKADYEHERQTRQQAHQQQRQDIKQGLERKRLQLEEALLRKYSPDFAVQGFVQWPWDHSEQEADCADWDFWKLFACSANDLWNLVTSPVQGALELGQIVGDNINSAIWGDQYSEEVKQEAHQAIDNIQSSISNFIPPARVSPSASPTPASPLNEFKNVTYEPEVGLADPSQAAAWSQQKTVSNPAEIPRVQTDQMLFETLKFIQANRGKLQAFAIPILAKDIFEQLAVHAESPLVLSGLNHSKYQNCLSAATQQLDQIYNLNQSAQDINKKCGVAFNNIFAHFPGAVRQATGLDNFGDVLAKMTQVPPFLRDSDFFQKINRQVEVLQEKKTGVSRISATLDGDMLSLLGSNQQSTGELADWLMNLVTNYYPEASPYLNQNRQAVEDYIQDKDLVFVIESPRRCNQEVKIEIAPDEGYGKYGIGSFVSMMSSNNFIFDGEYSFKLAFHYKDNSNGQDPNVLHDLVVVKSPVAQYLDLSAAQLVEKARQGQVPYPLEMMPVQASFEPFNSQASDIFSLQIKNWTANYFDLKVEKVGNESCPPAYFAGCLNYKEATFKMNHRNYRTGMYRVSTRYSAVDDPQASPPQQDWDRDPEGIVETTKIPGKNINSPYYGSPFNYQFVALHADYATFVRTESKPVEVNIKSEYRGENTLAIVDRFNGVGSYFSLPDRLADPEPITQSQTAAPPEPAPSFSSSRVIGAVTQGLTKLQTTPAQSMGLSPASQNMLVDLAKSHPDAMSPQSYDAFHGLHFRECLPDTYLELGVVVNLTNQDYLNNQVLLNKSESLPMKLRVLDSQGKPFRTWPFMARIGSHTFFQVYWDGLGNLSHPTGATDTKLRAPAYVPGSYRIDVVFDDQELTQAYLFGLSAANRFGAEVTQPILLETSTQAQLEIEPSCASANLANLPDYELTEEVVVRLRQNMDELQTILLPYLNLDISNTSSQTVLIAEGYRVVDDFGLAQAQPPEFDVPKQHLEETLRRIESLNQRAKLVNQSLTRLEELGINSQTQEAKLLRQQLLSLTQSNRLESRRLTEFSAKFLNQSAFEAINRALTLVSFGAALDIPPQDLRIPINQNLEYIKAALEALASIHNERTAYIKSHLPTNIEHKLAILTEIANIQSDIFERWFNVINFISYYQDRSLLVDYLMKDIQLQVTESMALAADMRTSAISVFEKLNKIEEITDSCLSDDRKNRRIKGEYPNATPSFEELKCRIDSLPPDRQEEKSYLRINLSIRQALLFDYLEEDPKIGVGIGAGDLKNKTIGFAIVVNQIDGKTYLITAFSGEDEFSFNGRSEINTTKYKEEKIKTRIYKYIKENKALNLNLDPSEIDDRIILAKEAKNQNDENGKEFFPTLNTKRETAVKNDAEIKILETAIRKFGVLEDIRIHTDRVTCEYCQETIFLNNLGKSPYYLLDPTNPQAKRIQNIEFTGFPLYVKESFESNPLSKIINPLLNYLKD